MSMEKLIETATTQVPGLVVLVVLVRWFLGHMKGRDDFLKDLHAEHMLAREQTREALKDTSEAVRHTSVVLQEVRDVIRNCPSNRV